MAPCIHLMDKKKGLSGDGSLSLWTRAFSSLVLQLSVCTPSLTSRALANPRFIGRWEGTVPGTYEERVLQRSRSSCVIRAEPAYDHAERRGQRSKLANTLSSHPSRPASCPLCLNQDRIPPLQPTRVSLLDLVQRGEAGNCTQRGI